MKKHGAPHAKRKRPSPGLPPLAVFGLHLVGVAAVAVALASFVLPGAHMGVMWSAGAQSTEVGQTLIFSATIHVALSAVLWFGVAMVGQSLWKKRGLIRPRQRLVKRTKGSVYVEFLAVFPVFILLSFGLIQLTLINLGGALAHVASYEAARAVWLWEPELPVNQVASPGMGVGGQDVTFEDVEDRARIAGSLVMTPVAPGDYEINEGDGVTEEFEHIRAAMTARFLPGGADASAVASQVSELGQMAQDSASLVMALDSASIPERAYRKSTFSYLSTDILEVIREPDRVGVHFAYYQHMALPFVDRFFGHDSHPHSARGGRYFRWDIEYTFPPQRHGANRSVP